MQIGSTLLRIRTSTSRTWIREDIGIRDYYDMMTGQSAVGYSPYPFGCARIIKRRLKRTVQVPDESIA